jgi:beta-phosphoglucomutase
LNLQAIIFDFDGVVADSEPLHLRAFQQALGDRGVFLSRDEYFQRYLGFDDVGAFQAVSKDRDLGLSGREVAELVTLKGSKLQEMMHAGDVLFPGAADFIRAAASAVPIAVASGALRHEIDEILEAAGLSSLFATIVASGDTPESKPNPAPYRLAFERLRERSPGLEAWRCVAIEDSRWGLESARGAGLRCVGVTNSYPAAELTGAELVVDGLKALTLAQLDALIGA